MFPIPWNKTYRKKDGTLVNMEDVTGEGGSGIPPHSVADAGKVLGVTEEGSLAWIEGVTGNRVIYGLVPPTSLEGNDDDVYILYQDLDNPPTGYKYLEYIETTSSGPYIDTGVEQKTTSYFDVELQFPSTPATDTWAFGTGPGVDANEVGYYSGSLYFYIQNSGYQGNINTLKHKYSYTPNGCYIDGNFINNRQGSNWLNTNYYIFARNGESASGMIDKCRLYSCRIYDGSTLIRDFVPASNLSNELGLYDLVNSQFYPNIGQGTFVGGSEISGKRIVSKFIKSNDTWIDLQSGITID